MPGRSAKAKKKLHPKVRAEQQRIVKGFVETFERAWKERPPEEGNTQTATLARADVSTQMFGNWKRGDDDPTVTSLVAIAFALDRRIDFNLQSMSNARDTLRVVTDDEQGETVSEEVMDLAAELDDLPVGPKQHMLGVLRGLLLAHKVQHSPTRPAVDQGGRDDRTK